MEYELVIFKENEREKFENAFATLSHDADETAQRRRIWWCFGNPNGGAFALFKSGQEIAATCYLGGKKLNIGGEEIGCFEIGETATSPTHQRKGLFSKLVKAVVEHSARTNQGLVYGTPNGQSTPGYAKLGFDIIESSHSWLFVLPSLSRWLRFRLPQIPSLAARGTITELTIEQYAQTTRTYSRLNVSNECYLDWRFDKSPAHYRFFQIRRAGVEFVCAVKESVLGKYSILVVSEYYLNGRRPPVAGASPFLKRAIWRYFDPSSFLGLYVHGNLPTKAARLVLWLQAIVPHRQLPICATITSDVRYPDDWFECFQLSDCDIG
jgi:GNAT superfamily N-acetyltransferase